jgi:hypothetical protein
MPSDAQTIMTMGNIMIAIGAVIVVGAVVWTVVGRATKKK